MKIYFAADHGGFEMKNELLAYVRDELGQDVEDCGAFVLDKGDDYPAFIARAARKLAADVAAGIDSRAIIGGASGQGEAMVANRFKGVRCAVYYGKAGREQTDMSGRNLDVLASSREHNNANALSLGFRFLSHDDAKSAVAEWLSYMYTGQDRHARRIKQIDDLT